MQIHIAFTTEPIGRPQDWPAQPDVGSLVEFYGQVRASEGAEPIAALHYEAYTAMAEKVMREKLESLASVHPCHAVRVIHRLGSVAVGESAIYVGIQSRHRREGFALLAAFMDELKKDVPVWKSIAS